jgi:hypothetical protein
MSENKQEKTPEQIIKEKSLELLNEVRFNAENRIRNTEEYQKIAAIKDIDLPKHINDYPVGSPKHHIISCRLSGEDSFDKNLSLCMQLLWDVEFNYEDYQNIGYNDGQAVTLSIIFNALGMKEEATQVMEATYKSD